MLGARIPSWTRQAQETTLTINYIKQEIADESMSQPKELSWTREIKQWLCWQRNGRQLDNDLWNGKKSSVSYAGYQEEWETD